MSTRACFLISQANLTIQLMTIIVASHSNTMLPFKFLTWFSIYIFLQVHARDISYTPSCRSWTWLFQWTQVRCIKLFKFFVLWLDFICWELVWRWKLWEV